MAISNHNLSQIGALDVNGLPVNDANIIFRAPGDLPQDPREYAVTCVIFCNIASAPASLTVHVVPYEVEDMNGIKTRGVRSPTNIIVKDLIIPPAETFTFDTEKLVLNTGDTIFAYASQNGALVATVSYLRVS